MTKNYLLIDGNSLGHCANNTKPLKLGDLEVQAIFHFVRMLRDTICLYQNFTPIVLWDGFSWRKNHFAAYKEGRDKTDTLALMKQARAKDAYKAQTPYIEKALRLLGIAQMRATNMEADDLGAYLADRFAQDGRVVLYSGDKDWLQLVGPNVVWRDVVKDRKPPMVRMDNFEEATGVATPAQFVQLKALMGDSGDSVPGVGGIGKKGAIDFINAYGSFERFLEDVSITKTIDFKSLPKKFRDLVIDEEKAIAFSRNIDLVDLRSPARPAIQGLTLDKGAPDAAKFRQFCEILLFNSILKDFDLWISPFPHFRSTQEIPSHG